MPEVNGPNGRKVGQSWGHLVQTQLAMLRAEQMAGISDVWYLLSYLYALSHPHVQSSPAQVSNPGWCIGPVCINPYVWGLEIGAKLAQANEPSTSETTQPIEVDVPDIGIDGGHAGLVY